MSMDTVTAPISPEPHSPLAELREAGRAVWGGLVWGGIMLLVLAKWLAVKDGGAGPLSYLTGAVGILALLLSLWPAATLWWHKPAPAIEAGQLSTQRRLIGLAFLAAGILLVVVALILGLKTDAARGLTLNLDNFGAAAGLLLFALIAVGAGLRLQASPGASAEGFLEALRRRLTLLKIGLALVGIILLALFAYLALAKHIGADAYPELLALLLLSALCFGTIIWLGFNASRQTEGTYLRVGVLLFGGCAGIILFLMALARAWLWRQEIFLGGMNAWQGEGAWRLWLVAYVQLAALALIFGSFGLARTDVRNNLALRRTLYGYNTFFQGLLVLEILLVLLVVVYALAPYTFQWSKARGLYALSPASQNLLSGLRKEAHVFVLMSPGSPTYQDLHHLLDNAQMQTSRLDVKYISPDRDVVEYDRLAKLFPKILPDVKIARNEDAGRGVLLVYGAMPKADEHDTKYSFIADRKLTDQKMEQGRRPTRSFVGESEIMRELKFLAEDKVKRKICVLQGAGLPDLSDMSPTGRRDVTMGFARLGVGQLADKLRKENYDVQGLSFDLAAEKKVENLVYAAEAGADKKKDVPLDGYALVIAGVSHPLATEVIDAITRYADRGGRLMNFLDVITDDEYKELKTTGLEPLLKRYGVEVQPGYPLRVVPRSQLGRVDPEVLIASAPVSGTNPIAKQFWSTRVPIILRRTARLINAAKEAAQYKIEPLLQLDPEVSEQYFLVENSPSALRNPSQFEADLFNDGTIKSRIRTEPLTVAVAVSETQNEKPRLIVFGDTDFITNLDLLRAPRDQSFALVLSGLEWMSEREAFIGPKPQETTVYTLPVASSETTLSRMVNIPGWLMLLTLLGVGTGIWLVRRR
jgi:hypothetical protein